MTDPTTPPDGAAAALSGYVDAGPAGASDPFIIRCAAEATDLVAALVAGQTVPAAVLDRAILEVGADLFYRRQTRNGVAGFADADLNPVRIARDPLAACRDMLRPYLGGGFA